MLINPARDDPTSILKEVGDFVIHIGTTIQSSGLSQHFPLFVNPTHRRSASGEEMKSKKGSNSLPQILYPLQITYLAADGTPSTAELLVPSPSPDCLFVVAPFFRLNRSS